MIELLRGGKPGGLIVSHDPQKGKLLDLLIGCPQHEKLDRCRLKGVAHLIDVPHFWFTEHRHPHASRRRWLNEPKAVEAPDCLADRGPAYAGQFHELTFGQPSPWS